MTGYTIFNGHKKKRAPVETKQPGSRIPHFKSVEEAAAFWDTHSFEAFDNELEIVTEVTFVEAQEPKTVTIRLDPLMRRRLAAEARKKGITPAALARAWILEHLQA